MSLRSLAPLLVLVLVLVLAPTLAAAVDWDAHADDETVTVIVTQADGTLREVTVWLAVLDGQGYIRTGNTSWAPDVERTREVGLRIGQQEARYRVEFVEDDALRERVEGVFRAKYGFQDALLSLFRGGRPHIMRLIPEEGGA